MAALFWIAGAALYCAPVALAWSLCRAGIDGEDEAPHVQFGAPLEPFVSDDPQHRVSIPRPPGGWARDRTPEVTIDLVPVERLRRQRARHEWIACAVVCLAAAGAILWAGCTYG